MLESRESCSFGARLASQKRSATAEVLAPVNRLTTIGACLLGLALLIFASKFIVTGAQSIATAYGVSQFEIGATVVAVGTSVPELATAVIAKLKGPLYCVYVATVLQGSAD